MNLIAYCVHTRYIIMYVCHDFHLLLNIRYGTSTHIGWHRNVLVIYTNNYRNTEIYSALVVRTVVV